MRQQTPIALAGAALSGDRRALARILTWIENDVAGIEDVLGYLYPHSGTAYTVGLTGAPGAGKSTLTHKLIGSLRRAGDSVGVLAIDPTSPFTGGAVLGDRIRMTDHAGDDAVFIRSLATRGHLGGLAAAVPRSIRALDAYGFDWILIETVGVGQAEVDVAGATDTTVVVMTPGTGDHIQASKAGLMEVGDVFVVNKADRPGAKLTARDLRTELTLGGKRPWRPPVVLASAAHDDGIEDLVDAIRHHRAFLEEGGGIETRRRAGLETELHAAVRDIWLERLERELATPAYAATLDRVLARELDPAAAARDIFAALTETMSPTNAPQR